MPACICAAGHSFSVNHVFHFAGYVQFCYIDCKPRLFLFFQCNKLVQEPAGLLLQVFVVLLQEQPFQILLCFVPLCASLDGPQFFF
jgi:hypothetical protein